MKFPFLINIVQIHIVQMLRKCTYCDYFVEVSLKTFAFNLRKASTLVFSSDAEETK